MLNKLYLKMVPLSMNFYVPWWSGYLSSLAALYDEALDMESGNAMPLHSVAALRWAVDLWYENIIINVSHRSCEQGGGACIITGLEKYLIAWRLKALWHASCSCLYPHPLLNFIYISDSPRFSKTL